MCSAEKETKVQDFVDEFERTDGFMHGESEEVDETPTQPMDLGLQPRKNSKWRPEDEEEDTEHERDDVASSTANNDTAVAMDESTDSDALTSESKTVTEQPNTNDTSFMDDSDTPDALLRF